MRLLKLKKIGDETSITIPSALKEAYDICTNYGIITTGCCIDNVQNIKQALVSDHPLRLKSLIGNSIFWSDLGYMVANHLTM